MADRTEILLAGQLTRSCIGVGRVEDAYGNLDSHFAGGTLQDIIDELEYSVQDERRNREKPFKDFDSTGTSGTIFSPLQKMRSCGMANF